jgi:hypothetical protein
MAKATVGLDIDINSNSVATATRRSDALAQSTDNLTRGLRGLGTGVAVAGAAVAAAAGGLLVMTQRIADQADEIAKHSTRIGVTIESYQELSHAMELSGGSIGEASAALRRAVCAALTTFWPTSRTSSRQWRTGRRRRPARWSFSVGPVQR